MLKIQPKQYSTQDSVNKILHLFKHLFSGKILLVNKNTVIIPLITYTYRIASKTGFSLNDFYHRTQVHNHKHFYN